jgi:DNA-binding response OmpR family regulator
LVVDDDLRVCLAIKAWLDRHGFAVTIAVADALSESRRER